MVDLIDIIKIDTTDGAIYHNDSQSKERGSSDKDLYSLRDLYEYSFTYAKIVAMADFIISNNIHDIDVLEKNFLK